MGKKLTYRYIFSFSLCLGILLSVSPAEARSRYWPTGVQLGMDLASPLYYQYYQQQVNEQREISTSIDFYRLLVEVDYGWGSVCRDNAIERAYEDEGEYYRGGLSYNLVPDTPDRNTAFLGVRYASSSFKEQVSASWYELVAGVKVKVWQICYVGSTFRYKFGLSIDEEWRGKHLLGWGSYSQGDDETVGLSCYILFRIPFERWTVAYDQKSPKN